MSRRDLDDLTHRDADWAGLRVLVTGLGVSGFAAADALIQHDALVTVVDRGNDSEKQATQAGILGILGADVRLGAEHVEAWPEASAAVGDYDLVVTSPGWRPDSPVLRAAQERGIPVWSEVELAWRLRPNIGAAPWLAVTGTNGKTTTVQLVETILRTAGLRAVAVGNVGTPILDAVQHPEPYDVIAVELSSFQLHHTHTMAPLASVVLNLAPDHLDWHGSMEAYAADKARIYERTQVACVYNVQDPATERMVEEADVEEGCRAVGFTLGTPGLSMVGLVEDVLADRAFIEQRRTSAAELGTLDDLRRASGGDASPPPHLVANALAAAALVRALGVPATAVRDGLRAFRTDAHRTAIVAEADGVTWVDDSKATNPHAAQAALLAYPDIVWIAGGQLKGADIDELVASVAGRLRGVVLLGADRAQIAESLSRHAPDVPVHDVGVADHGDMDALGRLMDAVVARAAELAEPGHVVLLSPAAASLDMFPSYGSRGDVFADAVRRHLGSEGQR
ncbi:UDP-N-acetylmuramoyl-L-alanine--D-glutamate ligase [Ornithinimicrobium tianjinense]|uniref:UDP-N-acetylmuramoylalanine--D-glutamate ligase n=1 Tax=Ornithinimicrobium tianjinense TaxID=1195761 RepID=A0A917BHE7_9MICO|nr:UDP-N-acetylmuramoyl-L-alanine--D-glutamate ligase [Ornithinimicrobium tianjinense]GGF44583.1 UDP-N-acetylmuramoylalanine--D-glutamate ligase [Ornithinimicrobium tianjinense]